MEKSTLIRPYTRPIDKIKLKTDSVNFSQSITMYDFLHVLLEALGQQPNTDQNKKNEGDAQQQSGKRKLKRGNQLKSFDYKREHYMDSLESLLLECFTGEEYNQKNKEEAVKLYSFLFKRIEELIYVMQRQNDRAILSGATLSPIDSWENILIILLSVGYIADELKDSLPIDCPFIYTNKLMFMFFLRDSSIPDVVNEMIKKPLGKLKGDWPASTILLYEQLNNIRPDNLASLKTIKNHIKTLRAKIELNQSINPEQDQTIKQIKGSYHALMFLLRLHRTDTTTSMEQIRLNLQLSSEYAHLSLLRISNDPLRRLIQISFENLIGEHLIGEQRAKEFAEKFYETFTYMHNQAQQELEGDVNYRAPSLYGAFFENFSTVLDYSKVEMFENFSKYSINDLVKKLDQFSSQYQCSKILAQSLKDFENKNIDTAIKNLQYFLKLKTTPYVLKRLASILYIGIVYATEHKVTPYFLSNFIKTYTETSLPTLHLEVMVHPNNERLKQDLEKNLSKNSKFYRDIYKIDYDKGLTLIKILSEYNRLFEGNKLDRSLVANPVKDINIFLKAFFERYDKYKIRYSDDTELLLTETLRTLKTKYNKAKIKWLQFILSDLQDEWILDKFGLNLLVFPSDELDPIYRYLALPLPVRENIISACQKLWGRK